MNKPLKILWLCGVPYELQEKALDGQSHGASAAWSWVMGHLPPPQGVELHIACPAKNIKRIIQVEYKGATFHLFPYMKGAVYTFFRTWLPGFRKIFDLIKPDWVHGWGTEAGFSSAALKLSPHRSIVEIQGILSDYVPHIDKSIGLWFGVLNERITLMKAQRLLAESEYSASETRKYTKGKVRVIPHPLRDDFLNTSIGQRLEKRIVFLGTLNDRKGIKDAIQAFAAGSPDDWRLMCIGSCKEEYKAEIDELLTKLQIEDRVEFHEGLNASNIISICQECPVFLLPTYMDTGPTALKEALAMGLWPVCYNNSGPRELINRYGYGSLAETGNIDMLTKTLAEVLVEKPWVEKGATEACVKRIRYDLSPVTIWENLMECYTDEFWTKTVAGH